SADQTLDLHGAADLPAPSHLPRGAAFGGAGNHGVFTGDPPSARAFLERRNTIFHRGRANHLSLTQANQRRTLRGINEMRNDFNGSQLGGGTPVRPDELAT